MLKYNFKIDLSVRNKESSILRNFVSFIVRIALAKIGNPFLLFCHAVVRKHLSINIETVYLYATAMFISESSFTFLIIIFTFSSFESLFRDIQ
ncbi:MAG: hypothetical protein EA412_11485 [Chitinophagaceae bacterium]|nr:MAG: hypothetical protein EA412_11485 [Chitinophagaceae bacterium]